MITSNYKAELISLTAGGLVTSMQLAASNNNPALTSTAMLVAALVASQIGKTHGRVACKVSKILSGRKIRVKVGRNPHDIQILGIDTHDFEQKEASKKVVEWLYEALKDKVVEFIEVDELKLNTLDVGAKRARYCVVLVDGEDLAKKMLRQGMAYLPTQYEVSRGYHDAAKRGERKGLRLLNIPHPTEYRLHKQKKEGAHVKV